MPDAARKQGAMLLAALSSSRPRLTFAVATLLAAACSSSSSPLSGTGAPVAPPETPGDAGATSAEDAAAPTSGDAAPVTPPASCAATGATLDPSACRAPDLVNGDVPRGCAPTVDGALHEGEWSDAACFTVGAADMRVYVKYAGDALYMATIGNPTCGCGMQFDFAPSGATTLGDDEFTVSVFDDPFDKDGDRTNAHIANGAYVTGGSSPPGIVTACPGGQPSPVPYEWKIPFSALQITPGASHTFRMAIVHAGAKWPSGLTINASQVPDDAATWGTLTSSRDWK